MKKQFVPLYVKHQTGQSPLKKKTDLFPAPKFAAIILAAIFSACSGDTSFASPIHHEMLGIKTDKTVES